MLHIGNQSTRTNTRRSGTPHPCPLGPKRQTTHRIPASHGRGPRRACCGHCDEQQHRISSSSSHRTRHLAAFNTRCCLNQPPGRQPWWRAGARTSIARGLSHPLRRFFVIATVSDGPRAQQQVGSPRAAGDSAGALWYATALATPCPRRQVSGAHDHAALACSQGFWAGPEEAKGPGRGGGMARWIDRDT